MRMRMTRKAEVHSHRPRLLLIVGLAVSALGGACASDSSSASSSTPPATESAPSTDATSTDTWVGDLEQIDVTVRARHDDPFSLVPEAEWVARLEELKASFPTATDDERIVGMASLAGLLDSHTWFWGPDQMMYEVLLYRFSDGVFVVAAADPEMIGWQLTAINGTPVADVETLMQPLIPADNDSAYLNVTYMLAYVDYLHGLGVVDDLAKPAFEFLQPDGTATTVDLAASDVDDFFEAQHALGSLVGGQNEAIRRRPEPIWWRVDEPIRTILLSLNDHSTERRDEAIAAITAALDAGVADRVVVDMRYLRGGDGSLLMPIVEALANDPRVNRPGGLTVLIGRENESAGTIVASRFDRDTQATLVGERTPARADNYLCPCHEQELDASGYFFMVPKLRSGNGDTRSAVEPDTVVQLSSVDFFAGRDPVLQLALDG